MSTTTAEPTTVAAPPSTVVAPPDGVAPPIVVEQPPKKEWAPRIWEGCEFFGWMRLLTHNRFQVDWSHLYIAIIITFVSMWHLVLKLVQQALYGGSIARTKIKQAPIFIIGHWRTG